jgi:hypothetical protein
VVTHCSAVVPVLPGEVLPVTGVILPLDVLGIPDLVRGG